MILPWSGRPGEVDSDQIEMLIENNKRYTTWEIADVLEISKSIVIGENEKCVFYFMEKLNRHFSQAHTSFPHYFKASVNK